MRRGFTLVELSIVLVIIGLLIGGILIGMSMISTAKVQSFIKEINSFDIALTNFKQKHNSFPGDTAYFDVAGDSDGVLEPVNSAIFSGELSNF